SIAAAPARVVSSAGSHAHNLLLTRLPVRVARGMNHLLANVVQMLTSNRPEATALDAPRGRLREGKHGLSRVARGGREREGGTAIVADVLADLDAWRRWISRADAQTIEVDAALPPAGCRGSRLLLTLMTLTGVVDLVGSRRATIARVRGDGDWIEFEIDRSP